MSHQFLKLYSQARQSQAVWNEARHIRTKVNEARGSPHDAAVRWPFELLQNALDAGPRSDRKGVQITLRADRNGLVFEHDGAYFKIQDLAALLSGGSSKGFDDAETIGRFGTGFLVTHVMAPSVQLGGLLAAEDHVERFELTLDRSGDEDAIVRNIEHCNEAIENAVRVEDTNELPSARFLYARDDVSSVLEGIEAFRAALPYLFATCALLSKATIQVEAGNVETWVAGDVESRSRGDSIVTERALQVTETGDNLRAIRISSTNGHVAAVAILGRVANGWGFRVPPKNFPRAFCRYPIRTSAFLPINAVLDAPFDLDQERRKVLLGRVEERALFQAALAGVAQLVELAFEEQWEDRHLLARVEPSPSAFSDEGTERQWLDGELSSLAKNLSKMRIVETPRGLGTAVSADDWYADFIRPRLSKDSSSDDTTIDEMWDLVADAENLYPPKREIAASWSVIGSGWANLGVEVNLVTLADLADSIRGEATDIGGLLTRCDRREWIARFLNCIGECWKRSGVKKELLDRLLPNQHGILRSGAELSRDKAIPEELKDVANSIDVDVRARLLDGPLSEILGGPGFANGADALQEVVRTETTERDVVQSCVDQLKKVLPEGKPIPETAQATVAGSVRLLDFLWRTWADEGSRWAKEVPLVARDGKAIRVSPNQRVMAPVSAWTASARAFSDIYPPNRVLSDDYDGSMGSGPNVVHAMQKWGIAHADPLVVQSIGGADLKDDRLQRLLVDGEIASQGLSLANTAFSQIALLHEILPRCAERPEFAASLLGFLLTYVAPNDLQWQTTCEVAAQRGQDSVTVAIRPALWLADVRLRPWIPIVGEEGRRVVVPDHHALRPMLRPEWHAQNESAIQLLTTFFGFGALDLRLAGVASDEHLRAQISDELARVVSLFGGDVARYGSLAAQLEAAEQSRRRRERFMNLGHAVQAAVETTLLGLGLTVKLIDCGFDFEVSDGPLEEGSQILKVGPVLVEVKATTTDKARMTPKQASTAAARPDNYVLCVVDLRGLPDERLDEPWTTPDILRLSRITNNVGVHVQSTWALVEQARDGTVSISGDGSLRYEVPSSIWGNGLTIGEWLLGQWGDRCLT